MALINRINDKPVHLTLAKDRVRSVKRGRPWVFSDVLTELPKAPAGSLALLKTADGEILAKGYYDPGSKLAFRSIALQKEKLDEALVQARLDRAADLRAMLFDPQLTTGYRLVNGEGDGLPGLVIDVYADSAVMKLDGAGAEAFYSADAIANWLVSRLSLRTVFLKFKSGDEDKPVPASLSPSPPTSTPQARPSQQAGRPQQAAQQQPQESAGPSRAVAARGRGRLLAGVEPSAPVQFLENGLRFQADIVQGQKTGFFLDQRNNRACIRRLARGKRTLNVFGYTGGFSVYAGAGGASHVTTVDVGRAALGFADANWRLNGLDPERHATAAVDAFEFLESAAKQREKWDLVIIDPPSFAPNKQAVEKARASYVRVFTLAAQITAPGGTLALASCSSHIDFPLFMEVCEEAVLGRARRQGYVLQVAGQPEDHPYPAACEELRYLKFVAFRLEG